MWLQQIPAFVHDNNLETDLIEYSSCRLKIIIIIMGFFLIAYKLTLNK